MQKKGKEKKRKRKASGKLTTSVIIMTLVDDNPSSAFAKFPCE